MHSKELIPWLNLSLIPGMSDRLFNRLLQYFQTPERVLSCDLQEFRQGELSPGLKTALETIQSLKQKSDICLQMERALEWQADKNHHILTLKSETYPHLLKQIADPPPLLYVAGNPEVLGLPQIAMVGSRKATPGGKKSARLLAAELARGGFTICSGMATGIDYESHQGALEQGAFTTAVLGSGIDKPYPPQNLKLAAAIREQGALVSEFPLGSEACSWHFPQRNRIISGLSQGVVVVEAALRSGSLITARYALEQGREVFAVPGSTHNHLSRGCHYLLKSGAKLVESAEDVAEELGAFFSIDADRHDRGQDKETDSSKTGIQKRISKLDLGSQARALLDKMDYDVTSIDELVQASGYQTELINALLTELEMQGLIQARTGGYTLAV